MAPICATAFETIIKNNPDRIHRIYQQCRDFKIRPYQILYPNLKCPIQQYTLDDMVWEHCYEEGVKRDMQVFGMGGLKGIM